MDKARRGIEWPTLALMAACYGLWIAAIFWLSANVAPMIPKGSQMVDSQKIAAIHKP
ncbi:MAG: hypothetical protein AAGL92_01760 [Pseudomonadota bacterium]